MSSASIPPGGASPVGVLVVPTEYRAGPWACRSLAAAGHRVVGADSPGRVIAGRSPACLHPLRLPSPRTDRDAFVAAVARVCREEGLAAVLPVSEDATRAIAAAGSAALGVTIAGPDAHQYDLLCDKAGLGLTCAETGVDHPETVVVEADGSAPFWPPLPSIVKPRLSGEALQGSDAATAVHTAVERERAVASVLASGLGAIVQQMVSGRPWVIHIVRGADGIAMVSARVDDNYPRGVGTSSVSRTGPTPPAVYAGAVRLLDAIDYRGPCCFNLIEENGRFWLHDVNLRLAASVGAAVRSGFDQPRLGVEAALGLPWRASLGSGRRALYARWDGEVNGMLDELREGRVAAAGRTATRLAAAALSPRGVVDPSPLDPVYLAGALEGRALGALRAARHAGRRVAPAPPKHFAFLAT